MGLWRRKRERNKVCLCVVFTILKTKGQEVSEGFRIEVQYSEFRLRCVMKKQSSTAQSLYVQQSKTKTKSTREGYKTASSLCLCFAACPLFTPSFQLSDTASSETVHVKTPNAALFWTAAVVAARRIEHSPTLLPAVFRFSFVSVFRVEPSLF